MHELCCGGEVFDRGAVCGGSGSQTARGGCRGGEFGEAAAQYAVLDAGKELRGVQAVIGDPVAVAALDPSDQCPGLQAAQVVGHLPGGDGAGVESTQLGGVCAQVFLLVNPFGWQRNTSSADSSAWVRCSANRSPGMRMPLVVVRVPVMAARRRFR